uniref:Uncharacterized protein n=1 Tax=Oryza sativa subsp. japonica TaxID=39947 RepID=Q60EA1_ORYSJ|nr:hypothetical protein [Oryza sativa Japonica Group]
MEMVDLAAAEKEGACGNGVTAATSQPRASGGGGVRQW